MQPSKFQSTPPARGATNLYRAVSFFFSISIHAPREGGDFPQLRELIDKTLFQSTPPARGATSYLRSTAVRLHISIHAPREGGDFQNFHHSTSCVQFQSTPPARGATQWSWRHTIGHFDFNPRPPRGGRLPLRRADRVREHISIHAPREGGDSGTHLFCYSGDRFQSTPPARGATRQIVDPYVDNGNFNPRPPRGGRLHILVIPNFLI